MRVALLVSNQPVAALGLARTWSSQGATVTVILLDAAVALARPGHGDHRALTETIDAGVAVLACRQGRRDRGALPAVEHINLDEIADLIGDGADKVVWW